MKRTELKELLIDEVYEYSNIIEYFRVLLEPSRHAVLLIRKMQFYYSNDHKLLGKIYAKKLSNHYGIYIHPFARIEKGLKLPHPVGIVIGAAVKCGKNITIYQNVTLGSANIGDWEKGKQPSIGDNVILYAGAKIIGNITVNDGSIVGANSVLNRSTEANCIYAGIPAKKITKY